MRPCLTHTSCTGRASLHQHQSATSVEVLDYLPTTDSYSVLDVQSFPERVQALRRVITARHSSTDGGWPHRLDLKNAASSIVSTAHVLEMLRAWNYEFRDPEIQTGLKYLASAVKEHTQPKTAQGSGRGESARYPAFALWGLCRFPQGPFSSELASGLRFALKWLGKNKLPTGGWAMQPDGGFSFTVSMPAIHSLDRLSFHPEYGKLATVLAQDGRNAVVRDNRGSKTRPWWTPYGESAPPNGAATAMAVLTLAGGNDAQRELARGGIAWLLNNPSEWVDRTETDMSVDDRSWQMLSFSLGLRAVLHPCAKERPSESLYRSAIRYWEELWVDDAGAWSHHPGGIPSTTGSFGVIVAARALKRAFPFDPMKHLNVRLGSKRAARKQLLPRPPLTVTLTRSEKQVHIVNQHGNTMFEGTIRGPAQWQVLELVSLQHLRGSEANDQLAQTIPLEQLASEAKSNPEACAKAIGRLNKFLTRRADQNHSQFLPALIEDISPSGSSGPRYGLDEVNVVVLDDAPELH